MPSYVLIWKVPTNQPTNRREREGDVCASVYTHSRVLAVPSFVINARNDDAEKTGDGPDLGVETMVFFFFWPEETMVLRKAYATVCPCQAS
jgi:hypothetical protein